MNPKSVLLSILLFVCSALAQLPPTFFTNGFGGGFSGFNGFGSPQVAGPVVPSPGNGRANTGPILFPPSPESRDTSGVVVGASGYGFIPPGVREIVQGRGVPPSSFSSSFGQFPSNYFSL